MMLKSMSMAALVAALGWAGSAGAQSWSFGVGVPIYGPPPVYYEEQGPGVYYEAPPPMLYDSPPLVVRPGRPLPGETRVFRMEAPELVLDRLDGAGYRDLGPMARRGSLYKLTAVAPDGDVVALEISIFTGEIERERVLERGRKKPARQARKPRKERIVAAKPAPKIAQVPVQAPAAKPPAAAAEVPPAGGSPSTLRDRLKPIPPTTDAGELPASEDPLVVY